MQTYRIAGLTVQMDSFGRIVEQARPYLTDHCDAPDMVVESRWSELKEKYGYLTDDDGEYVFTGSSFYTQLLNHDGLLLHSSAVVVDGRAYCFTADSGTGKSTHTGLWLKLFGDRAFILNDDKPALRLENGEWFAYGTPWSGKYDISVNARVPLAGIACLERGERNEIAPFGGVDVIHAIYKQSNRPKAAVYRMKILELLDKLITQTPVWRLKCNMDIEAAIVAYEAMSGEKWRAKI